MNDDVINAARTRLSSRPADALNMERNAYTKAVSASVPARTDVSHGMSMVEASTVPVSPRVMATPTKWADFAKHPLVEDVSDERAGGDGLWVYLRPPFKTQSTESHTIHEDTVAEVREVFRRDTRVDVAEAKAMGLDPHKLAREGVDAALFNRLGTATRKPAPAPEPPAPASHKPATARKSSRVFKVALDGDRVATRNSKTKVYTHAVVVEHTEASIAAAWDRLEEHKKVWATWEGQEERVAGMIAREEAIIRADYPGNQGVWSWASRLDLAEKAATQARKAHPHAKILIKPVFS